MVTDHYIAQFLPIVGDMLPSLKLVLKDKDGNPKEDIGDAIIYSEDKDLNV